MTHNDRTRTTRGGQSFRLALLCGGALMAGGSAAAETTATGAAATAVGEVIVTAQKRAEDVQKVPLTINAIGAGQLAQHQIQTIADLTTLVPGLRSDDVAGMSNISI